MRFRYTMYVVYHTYILVSFSFIRISNYLYPRWDTVKQYWLMRCAGFHIAGIKKCHLKIIDEILYEMKCHHTTYRKKKKIWKNRKKGDARTKWEYKSKCIARLMWKSENIYMIQTNKMFFVVVSGILDLNPYPYFIPYLRFFFLTLCQKWIHCAGFFFYYSNSTNLFFWLRYILFCWLPYKWRRSVKCTY